MKNECETYTDEVIHAPFGSYHTFVVLIVYYFPMHEKVNNVNQFEI